MVSEAVHTSEIEGERFNRDDVRSSIKNYLGLSIPHVRVADPKAEGAARSLSENGSSTEENPDLAIFRAFSS